MTPRLVTISGQTSGWLIYLDDPIISIGRQRSNTISLDDPFISRRHCLIRREETQYVIEDLSSTNGTYVDGKRVKGSLLEEGSLIQVGASQFLFLLHELDELIALRPSLVESRNDCPTLEGI
jgi:pSer/pThr/pTyr-binding forkhead associated (FHA) protein